MLQNQLMDMKLELEERKTAGQSDLIMKYRKRVNNLKKRDNKQKNFNIIKKNCIFSLGSNLVASQFLYQYKYVLFPPLIYIFNLFLSSVFIQVVRK